MINKEIQWQSPSNIALIKYWGKRDVQLPMNASLSISLQKSVTNTTLSYAPKDQGNQGLSLKFYFEGKRNPAFECKIRNWLTNIRPHLNFLEDYEFKIYSSNSFPHSSGIASSASSFGALALCLCSMEKEVTSGTSGFDSFGQKAAYLARLGSGSATRSIYGNYVVWGKNRFLPYSSDEFSVPLKEPVHEIFTDLCDSILIVSSSAKDVSSTVGHRLMKDNPYSEIKYKVASSNFNDLLNALKSGDEEAFVRIVESEALNLHAMFLTSSPGYILMQPGTLAIIDKIRKYREATGTFLCFTLDAGPNVHLLYPKHLRTNIQEFITSELLQHCENERWIDDEIGDGPVLIHN
jgi:diphosphomevalonate decarboxylase